VIKIGNQELVFSQTFLVSNNVNINFDVTIDDWKLNVTINLEEDMLNSGSSVSWSAISQNHAKFTFHNWSNSIGNATLSPFEFGTTDTTKRKIYFAACNYWISTVNRLDFQLFLGDENE